jgi:hypothetical protein
MASSIFATGISFPSGERATIRAASTPVSLAASVVLPEPQKGSDLTAPYAGAARLT